MKDEERYRGIEVELPTGQKARVPIRVIRCSECNDVIGFLTADEGYVPEGKIKRLLQTAVCPKEAYLYIEGMVNPNRENFKAQTSMTLLQALEKIFETNDVETIEELEEKMGSANPFSQVARKITVAMDLLDKVDAVS